MTGAVPSPLPLRHAPRIGPGRLDPNWPDEPPGAAYPGGPDGRGPGAGGRARRARVAGGPAGAGAVRVVKKRAGGSILPICFECHYP